MLLDGTLLLSDNMDVKMPEVEVMTKNKDDEEPIFGEIDADEVVVEPDKPKPPVILPDTSGNMGGSGGSKPDPNTGGSGGGGGSTTGSDTGTGVVMAKPNIPITMEPQVVDACVTALMEFINNELFKGSINGGVYQLDYE